MKEHIGVLIGVLKGDAGSLDYDSYVGSLGLGINDGRCMHVAVLHRVPLQFKPNTVPDENGHLQASVTGASCEPFLKVRTCMLEKLGFFGGLCRRKLSLANTRNMPET